MNTAKKIILDYFSVFEFALREDFEKVHLDKLPEVLDIQQKKNKIKKTFNYLYNKIVSKYTARFGECLNSKTRHCLDELLDIS